MKNSLKLDKTVTPLFLLALISAPLLLASNTNTVYSRSGDGKNNKAELKTPLSLAKVKEIERNIPKLKPGTKDVPGILGLTNYSNSFGVMGSGPKSDYRLSYYLRKGYSLTLVYDFTKKSSMFKRAIMHKRN